MVDDLESHFEAHLASKGFFKPGDRILVACSGGPDSVALFHLLFHLAPRHAWRLALLHFNHRLRPGGALRDEIFVRDLARQCGVPFFSGSGNVRRVAERRKASTEEAARHLRYAFFLKTACQKRYSKVVFAHTRDDQAETVLMRVLQGTGLRGLSGIREKIRQGRVTLIRPLLPFAKQALLFYLKKRRLRFRVDSSNHSLDFLRNRIRLRLIPFLRKQYNPRVVEALSRLPVIVGEEERLLSELEKTSWRKVLKRRTARRVEFQRALFLKFPRPLQFRLVEKALKRIHPKSGLSFDAWERVREGMNRRRCRFSLPKDIDLEMTPQNISIYHKKVF